MDLVNLFMNFFHDFIYGFGEITNFLTNPILNGLSPLTLLLPTGLIVYLGIAVGKWLFI